MRTYMHACIYIYIYIIIYIYIYIYTYWYHPHVHIARRDSCVHRAYQGMTVSTASSGCSFAHPLNPKPYPLWKASGGIIRLAYRCLCQALHKAQHVSNRPCRDDVCDSSFGCNTDALLLHIVFFRVHYYYIYITIYPERQPFLITNCAVMGGSVVWVPWVAGRRIPVSVPSRAYRV